MLRRTPMRRKARKSDVPDWLPGYLRARDKTCLAPRLARANGQDIDPCNGRLTIEHVKFESRIGRRAESDKFHCLLLCLHHNLTWALTTEHKNWERDYLRRVEGEADAA